MMMMINEWTEWGTPILKSKQFQISITLPFLPETGVMETYIADEVLLSSQGGQSHSNRLQPFIFAYFCRAFPCQTRCLRYHFGSMVIGGLVVGFCQPFRLALGVIAFVLQFQGCSCSLLSLGLGKVTTLFAKDSCGIWGFYMGFTWFYRFTLLVQKDFFKMGTFAIGNWRKSKQAGRFAWSSTVKAMWSIWWSWKKRT